MKGYLFRLAPASLALLSSAMFAQPDPAWKIQDMTRPRPPVIQPGTASVPDQAGRPPSDAVMLFDGSDVRQWRSMDGGPAGWIVKDGYMESTAGSGYVRSARNFGDCQLHVEWATPVPARGEGQGRGNSGVFLMSQYEVQVLDSFNNDTYPDGQAAALYAQYPPLVNACRPPGEWQSYDILFTRPRFNDDGSVKSPARVTVLQNGVLVQHEVELTGPTGWLSRAPYQRHLDKLPLALQDHGNPVRYRNIWVRELGEDAVTEEYTFAKDFLARYVGSYRVGDDMTIHVRVADVTVPDRSSIGGRLVADFVTPTKTYFFPLLARSESDFFVKPVDIRMHFRLDGEQKPTGLSFLIGREDRRGEKVH